MDGKCTNMDFRYVLKSISLRSLRKSRKGWILSPRPLAGGDTLNFGHTFSNIAHFRMCGKVLVEFRLVSSESSWRNKKNKK